MNDSESSAKFLSALDKFAASLSDSRLAIYNINYNMEAFGNWTVELGKRHHRLLLQWDGKESVLSVAQCNVANSGAVKERKWIVDEQIDLHTPVEELFQIAENLVLENARL